MHRFVVASVALLAAACEAGSSNVMDGGTDLPPAGSCTGPAVQCAASWEANASARYDAIVNDPEALAAFLKAVPKGGDLHNHLSGSVYAETYLTWGKEDGNCINSTTFAAVSAGQCSASTQPIPD